MSEKKANAVQDPMMPLRLGLLTTSFVSLTVKETSTNVSTAICLGLDCHATYMGWFFWDSLWAPLLVSHFLVLYCSLSLAVLEGVKNWEECQKLCQLADGCNFFNYGGEASETAQDCYLKYGLGRKKMGVKNRRVFGPKHCPGFFV